MRGPLPRSVVGLPQPRRARRVSLAQVEDPTPMLATLLLLLAASSSARLSSQDPGHAPSPPSAATTIEDLRSVPIAELLARQADAPWFKSDGKMRLKPEVEELQRRVESGALSPDEWRQLLLTGGVLH